MLETHITEAESEFRHTTPDLFSAIEIPPTKEIKMPLSFFNLKPTSIILGWDETMFNTGKQVFDEMVSGDKIPTIPFGIGGKTGLFGFAPGKDNGKDAIFFLAPKKATAEQIETHKKLRADFLERTKQKLETSGTAKGFE